ncbi:MAG: helix-turn-helix domain-containing protein [Chloroflexi bacterium]|nr:helix-turn-helix domain-containing protein [Chloroflexota bacterium]
MQSQTVSVWFDRDGDMLEVLWGFREGIFVPTEDDRILKRLDDNGDVVGFLVHEFSTMAQSDPFEFRLEGEPEAAVPSAVTVKWAAAELGVSDRRIRELAKQGRVLGASKAGHEWLIPTPIQVLQGLRGPTGAAQRVAESSPTYRPTRASAAPSEQPPPRRGQRRTRTTTRDK